MGIIGRIGRVINHNINKTVKLILETRKGFNQDAVLYNSAGEDSVPLREERIIMVKIDGSGKYVASGVLTPSQGAKPGEKIYFARDQKGNVVLKIKMLNNGNYIFDNNTETTGEASGDYKSTVKGNMDSIIYKDKTEKIKGNSSLELDGNLTEKIKGNGSLELDGNLTEDIIGVISQSTGAAYLLNAGAAVKLTAGALMTLAAAGGVLITAGAGGMCKLGSDFEANAATIKLNGGSKSFVTLGELNTELQRIWTILKNHTHAYATNPSRVGVSPELGNAVLDISAAGTQSIKTGG